MASLEETFARLRAGAEEQVEAAGFLASVRLDSERAAASLLEMVDASSLPILRATESLPGTYQEAISHTDMARDNSLIAVDSASSSHRRILAALEGSRRESAAKIRELLDDQHEPIVDIAAKAAGVSDYLGTLTLHRFVELGEKASDMLQCHDAADEQITVCRTVITAIDQFVIEPL